MARIMNKVRVINRTLTGPNIDQTYNVDFIPRVGETVVFNDGWIFDVSNVKHYLDEGKIHVYVDPR